MNTPTDDEKESLRLDQILDNEQLREFIPWFVDQFLDIQRIANETKTLQKTKLIFQINPE